MLLKNDLKADKVDSHLFQVAVVGRDTHEVYCHVYGKSPEECLQKAEDLVYAYNFSSVTD